MNAANATIDVDFKLTDMTTDCPSTAPTVAAPCFAIVRVRYTFRTVTPWPLIPNTANFDRSTIVRMLVAGAP